MSTVKVEVVPVSLIPHPNADTLSIATVKGWQCVVKTSDFEGVTLGAYIPIDSVVPETPEWEFLRPRHFRVRTIRLRGVFSQGLLIPAKSHWTEGMDVTAELGITKYEPPEPIYQGEGIPSPPGFFIYTDIENFQNFPDRFTETDEIVITEKIHGSNIRAGLLHGQFYVGSHRQAKREMEGNLYWKVARAFQLEERLRAYGTDRQIMLFGEVYGRRVQDLDYGLTGQSFCLFDIAIDGVYQDWETVCHITHELDLPLVPLLKRGMFSREDLALSTGQTTLSGSHLREGIVIKTTTEQQDPIIGRKILKYLSPEYLMREHGTEFH